MKRTYNFNGRVIGWYRDRMERGSVMYGYTVDGRRSAYVWKSKAEAVQEAEEAITSGKLENELE